MYRPTRTELSRSGPPEHVLREANKYYRILVRYYQIFPQTPQSLFLWALCFFSAASLHRQIGLDSFSLARYAPSPYSLLSPALSLIRINHHYRRRRRALGFMRRAVSFFPYLNRSTKNFHPFNSICRWQRFASFLISRSQILFVRLFLRGIGIAGGDWGWDWELARS